MDMNRIHGSHGCSCAQSKVSSWRPTLAGFVSSFMSSYLFYDSNQITLYSFWKSAFTLYWFAFRRQKERAQKIMDLIFFINDSILINCLIMEPQFIADSYLKFVDSITGGVLKHPNIICYQHLTRRVNERRYGSSVPILDARFVSDKYLQNTGVWSLENKN